MTTRRMWLWSLNSSDDSRRQRGSGPASAVTDVQTHPIALHRAQKTSADGMQKGYSDLAVRGKDAFKVISDRGAVKDGWKGAQPSPEKAVESKEPKHQKVKDGGDGAKQRGQAYIQQGQREQALPQDEAPAAQLGHARPTVDAVRRQGAVNTVVQKDGQGLA